MKRIKTILSAAAAAGLVLLCRPAAYAAARTYVDNTVDTSRNTAAIAAALVIIVLIFVGLAAVVRMGKSGHLNVPWAVLSVLLAGLALLLCVIGSTAGPLYARSGGDPAQTVAKFYDAVLAGDYPTAYSCLSDYTGLGLETEPAGDNAVKIYAALRESYDYALSGTAKVDGMSAVQNVRFRYLDLSSLEASVEDGMQRNIEKAARDEPADQVYDENNKYLPAVAEKAYSDALTSVLSHASSYYTASVIEVELTYTDGQWLIVTNRDMLNALMGGAAY